MKSPKQIEKFVRETFKMFHFDYDKFFKPYLDSPTEVCWENNDGTVNRNAVLHAGMILGLSEDTILNTDYNIVFERVNKYPYLKLANSYYSNYYHSQRYKDNISFEDAFWVRVFDDDGSVEKKIERYNASDIKRRLVETIKGIDEFFPGTNHQNAEIKNLDILTNGFFHFDMGEQFVESYIKMYDSLINLFFKAFDGELLNDETNEYNFLVTCFGFRLLYDSHTYNYYENIPTIKAIPDITKEKLVTCFRFTEISKFEPWRCAEFVNNKSLVQAYLDRFPQFKGNMRVFAMNATKIRCYFNWSDAKKLNSSEEIRKYVSQLESEQELSDEDYELLLCRLNGSERTKIYVDKTKEELADFKEASDNIVAYCRPKKLGGLSTKTMLPDNIMSVWPPDTLLFLAHNLEKHNYFERFNIRTELDEMFDDDYDIDDSLTDTIFDSEENGGSDNE